MKKFIVGLVVGLVIGTPVIALAASGFPANSNTKNVAGVFCKIVIGDDGKNYPSQCNGTVSKFSDSDNVCYVLNSDDGISCVKKGNQ